MPPKFGLGLKSNSLSAGIGKNSQKISNSPFIIHDFNDSLGIWYGDHDPNNRINWSNDATAQALAGTTGAMKIDILEMEDHWMYEMLAIPNASGIWRARFYIDPNGVNLLTFPPYMAEILVMQGSGGGETFILKFGKDSGGQYIAGILAQLDSGGGYAYGNGLLSDGPHCIEGEVRRSNGSNNGRARLWIDDVLEYDSGPTLDNDVAAINVQYFPFGVFGGTPYSAPGGSIYLDELVINDNGSKIGL